MLGLWVLRPVSWVLSTYPGLSDRDVHCVDSPQSPFSCHWPGRIPKNKMGSLMQVCVFCSWTRDSCHVAFINSTRAVCYHPWTPESNVPIHRWRPDQVNCTLAGRLPPLRTVPRACSRPASAYQLDRDQPLAKWINAKHAELTQTHCCSRLASFVSLPRADS